MTLEAEMGINCEQEDVHRAVERHENGWLVKFACLLCSSSREGLGVSRGA